MKPTYKVVNIDKIDVKSLKNAIDFLDMLSNLPFQQQKMGDIDYVDLVLTKKDLKQLRNFVNFNKNHLRRFYDKF